ncbi:MAG TPA: signal peptidase I [Spirochaetia bacterium]|nr:signal peptidase I [Spirochaetia bacterium]
MLASRTMNEKAVSRLDTVQELTEAFLTWRRKRKLQRKEKQRKKNPILDWVEAFLWAALVVLLINQYLLQAYQIPSESMVATLLPQDRIFVNKLIFGPELIPGKIKMAGFATPKRAQVIIFENPSYISRGPVFDVVQRVLYMLTLSLVDIDRNPQGEPRAHFLIKRAVGVGGDRLRVEDGSMSFKPEGEASWLPESDFKKLAGLDYTTRRILTPADYGVIKVAGTAEGIQEAGLTLTSAEQNALTQLSSIPYADSLQLDKERLKVLLAISPQDRRFAARYQFYVMGWWVPPRHIFPMGDNRDNSRDARYFGPVGLDHVLGKAMFRYWPPSRIGPIR